MQCISVCCVVPQIYFLGHIFNLLLYSIHSVLWFLRVRIWCSVRELNNLSFLELLIKTHTHFLSILVTLYSPNFVLRNVALCETLAKWFQHSCPYTAISDPDSLIFPPLVFLLLSLTPPFLLLLTSSPLSLQP